MHPEATVFESLRRLQIEWGLKPDALARLLHIDESTLQRAIGPDAGPESAGSGTIPAGFETAAPLISIHRHLARRYPDPEDQVKWLFTAHADFGGSKPIDVAASSVENLYWLGYYLASSALQPAQ